MDLAHLFNMHNRGSITFEAMKRADLRLGSPHKSYPTIHVAGTNGKGSVATKIASVLQHRGLKVGLYTSPHVRTFTERMQINGRMISEEKAEQLLDVVYDPSLSFFDCLTLMAFLYFQEEQVDIAVIEAGLGGRLDATNVIVPILSVITSIGLEHTAILGDTLELIAREKGGIIKPNVPLVVGPTAAPFFPNAIHVASAPFYELENRAIAARSLEAIGISDTKGLDANPPYRFQRIGKLLLDVAHNPQAFERLIEGLKFHFPGQKFPFFLAFSRDKDWVRCVEIASSLASS
ncbi:MAG: bifunctional folylpolyglutamate synthase/dihydrofolate synthase, partial [Verrucomicrobia bacterium]|nr:bifunctional folylpolyglutamate synthase/dihydrofolate synthase [Verrucomicrobiota bacterium]